MMTDADKHVQETRDKVQEAIEELAEVVVAQASGHDEYKKGLLSDAMSRLIEVRDLIAR